MHPRTKGKVIELNKLLLELIAAGVITSVAVGFSGSPRRTAKGVNLLFGFSKARIRQALARMRMQNLIRYNPRDLDAPLMLTKKGLARRDRYECRNLKTRWKDKKWDYLWRLAIFDIPESARHLREQLRHELYAMGFVMLQESVYVIPFECTKEADTLMRQLMIRRDRLIICVTPSLGRHEERIRRHFIRINLAPKNF